MFGILEDIITHHIIKGDNLNEDNKIFFEYLGEYKLHRKLTNKETNHLKDMIKNSRKNKEIRILQKEYGELVIKENKEKINLRNKYTTLHNKTKKILCEGL